MSEETLRAATAVGALGSEDAYASLLQSVVDVARAIFGAQASSIFLLDEEADELVFEAVSGRGEGEIIGMRFPSSTGIAGWVLVTRQPLVIEDTSSDARFARDAAEQTGYMPQNLMAVPLVHDERALGVLEVLDRPENQTVSLTQMDLLGLFANQAAIALDLLLRARRARGALASDGAAGDDAIARVASALTDPEGRLDPDGVQLLESLADLLERRPAGLA
jgi:GAF domain-containing protein